MSDSHVIRGGAYAPPRAWLELLAAAGFEVELPEDLRPVTGGTFYVRFKHVEVTGGEDARVEIGVLHHALAADTPAEVVAIFERRFDELIAEGWADSVLLERAIALGWVKGGRGEVLRYLELLKGHDVEIDEDIERYWSDPSARLEQEIESWAVGFSLCSVVAHEVFACAIADATGGRFAGRERRSPDERYLSTEEVRSFLARAREVPAHFDFSREDAEQWPRFAPFVSWEHVRALEAEEDAEEEPEQDEG